MLWKAQTSMHIPTASISVLGTKHGPSPRNHEKEAGKLEAVFGMCMF